MYVLASEPRRSAGHVGTCGIVSSAELDLTRINSGALSGALAFGGVPGRSALSALQVGAFSAAG